MDSFEFYNPVRVIFGIGKLAEVSKYTASLGKRILLVSYANHDFLKSNLEKIKAQFKRDNLFYITQFEITANPMLSQVQHGVNLCRENNLDCVVAVGGGSVMDAAKVIAAGTLYPDEIWKMIVSRHDSDVSVPPEKALPLLMVPTLPATSSEMNCGAVITNDATLEKSYAFHESIFPKVSIVDPELTQQLPSYQTACGAVDAISHVMESYFNCCDDTPVQDRLQESVIITIMELVRKVLADPDNLALRANIQWSSAIAWNGWIQAGVSPGSPMHQLGHVISARYNVTHGATLAIIMPAWMRYIYKKRLDRYVQFAERIFNINSISQNKEEVVLAAINRFETFLKKLEVPTRLSEVSIKAEDIEQMTEDVARISFNATGFLASRPPMGREDVRKIYEMAL